MLRPARPPSTACAVPSRSARVGCPDDDAAALTEESSYSTLETSPGMRLPSLRRKVSSPAKRLDAAAFLESAAAGADRLDPAGLPRPGHAARTRRSQHPAGRQIKADRTRRRAPPSSGNTVDRALERTWRKRSSLRCNASIAAPTPPRLRARPAKLMFSAILAKQLAGPGHAARPARSR